MQDTDNIAVTETSGTTDVFSLANEWYPILLSSCSVRAQNILNTYRLKFESPDKFYNALLKISYFEVKNLRNCGRKTVSEIMALSRKLRWNIGYSNEPAKVPPIKKLPENIDKILPLITEKIDTLTNRAKNAVSRFLQERGNSITNFYLAITAPSFKAKDIKNIGRSTVPEVQDFLDSIISLINEFTDEDSVAAVIQEFNAPKLSAIFISEEFHDHIKELQEELGHFPLFAVVSAYLKGLDDERKTIAENCIRIHEGKQIADRNDIGYSLGITQERVRQKRNKIIEDFVEYFRNIRKIGFIQNNPYRYLMTRVNEDVNSSEGTDFSLNFMNFVLGSTFDDVKIVGDIHKALTNMFYGRYEVALVPAELCTYFDFDAFASYLDQKLEEKRIDEERVDLKASMSQFYKVQYYEEYEKDIETACRSILYISYPVEVDMGKVIFKANMRKSNFLIVEDIIRKAGHPMTLDEIYDEFSYQYPERNISYDSFRGTINNNDNIIPIGRTSTYTLAEWNGEGNKGGTIRSLAIEYLNSNPLAIARFSEVAEYIVKYRPTTNESNIYDNLSLERTGAFKFYFLHGERYLGLGGREYPIEYFPLDSESKSAMNMSIKYPMLIEFIEANGRFPFSSGVGEEEIALHHFWSKQEKLYNEGKIDVHSLLYFQRIQEQYSQLKFEKKEFEWRQTLKQLIDYVEIGGYENLPQSDKEWVRKNCREYLYFKEKMPSWKVELIEKYLLKC